MWDTVLEIISELGEQASFSFIYVPPDTPDTAE
jgi:hypothetical protein